MENLTKRSLKRKPVWGLWLILLIIINISCQKEEVYSHFHEQKDAKWGQNDTLVFDVDSALFDVGVPYALTLEVTNNVNYPYQNIWFFVQANIENDSVFTDLSKEFKLADEFGKWHGSGFGTLFQSSLPLGDITFNERRNYRIKVEHGMRDEPLEGIEKVGIRISIKED